MAYTRLTTDLDFIQKLDDEPNDVGGLSAAELKAEFDKAGNAVKTYINGTLLTEMESTGAASSIGITDIAAISGAGTVQEALESLATQMTEITQGSVADASITTQKLADGAVTTEKIADGSVTGEKLAVGGISGSALEDDSVSGTKLADGSVPAGKLGTDAVESGNIANGAVTQGKLGTDAVINLNILDGAVSESKLNDSSVSENKLCTDAVTTGKIKNNAVTADKIAVGAVSEILNVTVPATGWSSGTGIPAMKTVAVSGLLATDNVVCDLLPSETYTTAVSQMNEFSKIYKITSAAGSITLYASGAPSMSLTLKLIRIKR